MEEVNTSGLRHRWTRPQSVALGVRGAARRGVWHSHAGHDRSVAPGHWVPRVTEGQAAAATSHGSCQTREWLNTHQSSPHTGSRQDVMSVSPKPLVMAGHHSQITISPHAVTVSIFITVIYCYSHKKIKILNHSFIYRGKHHQHVSL